ncbi:MAG TPA: hypothetical protein VK870_16850 [Ignavibacteriaceae bacterium]|nr:hypothetical protein [Ignavibacteriaceae bacterium]
MICYKYLIFWIILLSSVSFSQEINIDTIRTNAIPSDALERIQFRLDDFDFYREMFKSNSQILLNKDSNTLRLRTEMIIRQSAKNIFNAEDDNFYFLSPLYNKYLEDSKFNPVRYVLGLAQLSAAGYLAYRHIKKYGFIY